MASTIKIKNSSTASAVPTSSDLVQGELAVNVTDKRIFTENASGTVVELGTNPSIVTLPDGSASAPTLTNDGDTNTGIFFPAADTVAVATGGTERVRVDSSGNVGIGATNTYGFKQHIAAGASTSGQLISSTTTGVYTQWSDSTSTNSPAVGGIGNNLVFATGTSSNSERMRIDSSGNLFVGATSGGTSGVAGIVKAVGYNTKAGTSASLNTNNFNINFGTGAQLWIDNTNLGTFSLTSDYRIKKDIQTQTLSALDRVAQLRPVTYEFGDYKDLFKADGVAREGFIAHELQAVIPSAVDGEKDSENQIQSLRLDALCSVLTKAIQEQQALITTLTERITALEQA